jgi:hypothetical protein
MIVCVLVPVLTVGCVFDLQEVGEGDEEIDEEQREERRNKRRGKPLAPPSLPDWRQFSGLIGVQLSARLRVLRRRSASEKRLRRRRSTSSSMSSRGSTL